MDGKKLELKSSDLHQQSSLSRALSKSKSNAAEKDAAGGEVNDDFEKNIIEGQLEILKDNTQNTQNQEEGALANQTNTTFNEKFIIDQNVFDQLKSQWP